MFVVWYYKITQFLHVQLEKPFTYICLTKLLVMNKLRIAAGADHAGFRLKEKIREYLA